MKNIPSQFFVKFSFPVVYSKIFQEEIKQSFFFLFKMFVKKWFLKWKFTDLVPKRSFIYKFGPIYTQIQPDLRQQKTISIVKARGIKTYFEFFLNYLDSEDSFYMYTYVGSFTMLHVHYRNFQKNSHNCGRLARASPWLPWR